MNVSVRSDLNFLAHLTHGNCTGEFEPRFTGTDYCDFFHKPCNTKALIMAVVLDYQMRIIFTVKCPRCETVDALKFSIDFPEVYDALENHNTEILEYIRKVIFRLSPGYAKCVR